VCIEAELAGVWQSCWVLFVVGLGGEVVAYEVLEWVLILVQGGFWPEVFRPAN